MSRFEGGDRPVTGSVPGYVEEERGTGLKEWRWKTMKGYCGVFLLEISNYYECVNHNFKTCFLALKTLKIPNPKCLFGYIQDCLRKLEYCDKVLYFL